MELLELASTFYRDAAVVPYCVDGKLCHLQLSSDGLVGLPSGR